MMINDSDIGWLIEGDEDILEPGMVRIYEFLHGYRDIPIEEYRKYENDPLLKLLKEEIQKEINREVVRAICIKSKDGTNYERD